MPTPRPPCRFTSARAGAAGDVASPLRRQLIGAAAGAAAATWPRGLFAQSAAKVARIGFLAADPESRELQAAFLQGMRELGQIEGKNITVDWRFAAGNYALLPGLAAELVRKQVDVIVAVTTLAVAAAHQATTTIPIVMIGVADPIGEGFATSLSRPGKSITGLSNIVTEVSSKHVELLNAAVPRLSRIAVLINPLNPSDALILEQIHGAAYTRKLKVVSVEASTERQIETGFATIAKSAPKRWSSPPTLSSTRRAISSSGSRSRTACRRSSRAGR